MLVKMLVKILVVERDCSMRSDVCLVGDVWFPVREETARRKILLHNST